MRKILAAVLAGPNRPMEVQEFHEPELEQGSALLKVTLSEVCGTDVHLQRGHLHNVPYPIVPAHVSVGMLDKIRGTLRDANENVL